ncbi:unnamed protein product [Psylliodes chrysocephalus]|uniref:Uncharacterized protein n=1 Tax=Psylliodes chrysocephalus TaxID=3402493 RepID=A0A9P0GEF3_9CUCU|nr:unnamed protein product [Psylliodes chrysocephala]
MEKLTKIINEQKYVTLSSIIILTKGLEENYKNLTSGDDESEVNLKFALTQAMAQKIKSGIQERFSDLESSKTLIISTFLDPRFKHVGFSDDMVADRAKNLVTNLVCNLINAEKENHVANSTNHKPTFEEASVMSPP